MRIRKITLAFSLGLMMSSPLVAGEMTIPNTFSANTPAVAEEVNANFVEAKTAIDDNSARITENTASINSITPSLLPFAESLILDESQQKILNSWLGNPQQTWVKCYTKSIDGASATTYHAQCKERGPTVNIIKTDSGFIMGGYIPFSIDAASSGNVYLESNSAFLFSLTNNKKYHIGSDTMSSAVYVRSDYGPTFGGGHDILVDSAMNISYCNFPYSYNADGVNETPSNLKTQELCGVNRSTAITVSELEVYIQE